MNKHTQTAKAIRQTLKAKGITATVKAKDFDCVTIKLVNASPATVAEVKTIAKAHQYGHFDGMTDIYVTDNLNKDLPQVGYVLVSNEIDDSIYQKALDYLHTKFNEPKTSLDDISRTDRIYKLMMNIVKNEFGRGEEFWASL
ncbi:hypothetical protein [Moraxella sp. ZY210820]|uniref:hypothetical protein n=1 Tax=Moraxella sp. ZY210820 TaxID=2904123 RepID=UPI00272FCE8A|nr:hypothetical protein [Moraxella sp. ZY210820]WLF84820.1 hypothetical protein LU301_04985 [Moraxella sp. ZY210820]